MALPQRQICRISEKRRYSGDSMEVLDWEVAGFSVGGCENWEIREW